MKSLSKRRIKELLKSDKYQIKDEAIDKILQIYENILIQIKEKASKYLDKKYAELSVLNDKLIEHFFYEVIADIIIERAKKRESYLADIKNLREALDIILK